MGKKQVSFDLNTEELKKFYPTKNWNNAYNIIKRHMINNDFEWLQGSVYVSKKLITSAEVTDILDELVSKHPWLNLCMRDCRETNIGRENSKNHLFDKEAKILPRNEIKEEKENPFEMPDMQR